MNKKITLIILCVALAGILGFEIYWFSTHDLGNEGSDNIVRAVLIPLAFILSIVKVSTGICSSKTKKQRIL